MRTMLFNPYTGKPRDPRDIASDPAGTLMVDPDEPLRPAPKEPADLMAIAMERVARSAAAGPEAWQKLFFEVARKLRCLPSTFADGNDHVLRAAEEAQAARAVPPSGGAHG